MIPHDMGVCLCQDVNTLHRTRYSEPSTRHPTQWPHSSKITPTDTADRNGSPGTWIASLCRPSGRGSLTYSLRIASLRTRAERSDDTTATQPLARLCWLLPGASSCGARVRCAPVASLLAVVLRSISGHSGGPSAALPRRRASGSGSVAPPSASLAASGVVRRPPGALRGCSVPLQLAAAALVCMVRAAVATLHFTRLRRRGTRCGARTCCGRIRSTCGGPDPVLARG